MMESEPDPRHWNADMAPVPLAERRWGIRDMAVLWISMSALRRTQLALAGLYRRGSVYWYRNGFNPVAIVALLLGIAPCVPGFLGETKVLEVHADWRELYRYAWFVSFGIAFAVYWVGMKLKGSR